MAHPVQSVLHGGAPPPDTEPASALADDAPAPSLPIQLSALQALCRQVFGLRLAMIVIGAPFALNRADGTLGSWLVGAAVVFSLMGSYAMLRDWETLGPLVLKHRWLMGVDLLFGAVLLLTASPDSTLGYAAVCTPLLAGLLYGWRGAGIYTAIQIALLAAAYTAWQDSMRGPASTLLITGFCVAAGIIGVTLRNLMFRFGTATQALSEATARLAVADAVEQERARLAREMHDSVAKTLHGVALAADGLAEGADRMDPVRVKHQAGLVARSARKAAAESREILADLRRQADLGGGGVDLSAELAARVGDFSAQRYGRHSTDGAPEPEPRPGPRPGPGCGPGPGSELAPTTHFTPPDPAAAPLPELPHAVARQLLTITTEALENAHRHAQATEVTVEASVVPGTALGALPVGDLLRISIRDNGRGLPPGTDLEALRAAGHFGLVGMVERAATVGARICIGRGRNATGTEVRLDLPLSAASSNGQPTLRPAPTAAPALPSP
ncbi:sensor histidine kinase [Streptomyces apocyni]|uniref:sensor histidine kinase n=1 Tax=Streptomyces apocyni TaxID=2654677 RepID=UPI0012EA189D